MTEATPEQPADQPTADPAATTPTAGQTDGGEQGGGEQATDGGGPDTGDDATSAVEANLPNDDPRGNPAAADEDGATQGETAE